VNIPGRWVHRFAILLVCIIWPLVWLGGLVTTYDAGMAVPDWPGTYGYNMFLYPLDTWLFGPFDLLIEHGHRLLGATAGLVAICTLAAAFLSEPRRWVLWLASAVLLAVIVQGALGGVRVVLAERVVAMIHGCFAQAFFALATALAVVTSRWWWERGPWSEGDSDQPTRKWVRRWVAYVAVAVAILSYGQLLIGAQLRHLQPDMSPGGFRHLVEAHVGMAVLVWLLSGILAIGLWRCGDLALSRPAKWLVGLVALQICLGLTTWFVSYGVPWSTENWPWAARYAITAKGYAESAIVTAHVATGSLLIACSVMIGLRAWRAAEHQRAYSDRIVATGMRRTFA
jgi:cytochrome c oxidase assembly protein subunit 15